jgi:hypothetical protein
MAGEFEIIADGYRFRFLKKEYFWEYDNQDGYVDRLNKTVVKVFKKFPDDEYELHKTVSKVICVGDVDENTCLPMIREKVGLKCVRCGHIEYQQKPTLHYEWVRLAYARLGGTRDNMTDAEVKAVQDFLGPIPEIEGE